MIFLVIFAFFQLGFGQKIPENPCPQIFEYHNDSGGTFGVLTLPYNRQPTLELAVNVSLALYAKHAKLRLEQLTSEEDLSRSGSIQYKVNFPFTTVIPKLTKVVFNDIVYCTGPPEPLLTGGSGVTNLWARTTSYRTVQAELSNEVTTPKIEPITSPLVQPLEPCGVLPQKTQNLIVNGDEVTEWYPWLVAIMAYLNQNYSYRCTGNLISEKHVLTAAQCLGLYKALLFQPDDLLLILGKANITRWNHAETRGAEKIEIHPSFEYGTGHGDLALITLDRKVSFKTNIRPICMWTFAQNDLSYVENQIGIVAGWGSLSNPKKAEVLDPQLQQIRMPIIPQITCLRSNEAFNRLTSNQTFCAGRKDGSGPCIGDSGAPFMLEFNGKFYLRGLVSSAIKDAGALELCNLNQYIVFCDVAKFGTWIQARLR